MSRNDQVATDGCNEQVLPSAFQGMVQGTAITCMKPWEESLITHKA